MVKYFKRFIYFGYYIKKLDRPQLKKFMDHVGNKHDISKVRLWKNIVLSSFKYNISILEYFLFNFYELSHNEKKTYAGTGFMHDVLTKMNPKSKRKILSNKILFLKKYKPFIHHNHLSIKDLIVGSGEFEKIKNNESGKIVLKNSLGQCGIGIEVRNSKEFDRESLIKRLKETGNDIVEDFIQQHQKLDQLSPSGLNTVRIITILNKNDEVEILGARLRITINSSVDNLAAGNIAAPIELETGIVHGPGVYSDITKEDEFKHPLTGVQINGFRIPFWKESLEMVKKAALLHPDNRSIGWDVAITNKGPELLEGNHNWCKLLWQLPVKKGLKEKLEAYK